MFLRVSVGTFKKWCKTGVNCNRTKSCILSNSDFEEETGNSNKNQHNCVRYKKCSTSMLEAKIGKPPDVAQTCIVYNKKGMSDIVKKPLKHNREGVLFSCSLLDLLVRSIILHFLF